MKPDDLDDAAPLEPDDAMLSRVHSRSGAFRRRRRAQRVGSVVSGLLVLVLAGGIVAARVDSSDDGGRALSTDTTTSAPVPTTGTAVHDVTAADLGGQWRPTAITGYDGPLTTSGLNRAPLFRFDPDGKWGGSDGCNSQYGSYVLGSGGSIHFRGYLQTLIGCNAQLPTRAALEAARRVELRDGRLTFLAADGHELMRLVPANITSRLVVPSQTMTAGSKMVGHVVVLNESGNVVQPYSGGQLFFVGLGNDQRHQAGPVIPQGPGEVTVPVGESSYPVSIEATYIGCAGSPPVPTGFVACLPNGDAPPLPPGDYETTATTLDAEVPAPPPVTVHVVAAG